MPKFNVTFSEGTYQALDDMATSLDRPMSDVIREALGFYGWLVREVVNGNTLLIDRGERCSSEVVFPALENLKARVEERRHA